MPLGRCYVGAVTGWRGETLAIRNSRIRRREREGQREKENARVWERTERASERTRKATSCVNLCTQRVACDSNTGRFFPPASSPPPLSSSSPLSNSHERPADLQKTTSAISCRRRGCYLHLDSGPDPRKQKGAGRRRGETKKRQKGEGRQREEEEESAGK